MTPGARLQAAIELLAAIHEGQSPADRTAAAFFRARRYMGGQDRREVVDRAYAVLRRQSALDWWIARVSPERPADRERARMIAALALDRRVERRPHRRLLRRRPVSPGAAGGRGAARSPRRWPARASTTPISPAPCASNFPPGSSRRWTKRFGDELEAEMAALMRRAATDLRANTLKATRDEAIAALAREGVEGRPTPLSPLGIRVDGRPPLAGLQCFKAGLIEVQDEGSQLVALLTDARPGQRVVDFCAGAGGKTLALAAAMKNKGKLVACRRARGPGRPARRRGCAAPASTTSSAAASPASAIPG